MGNPGVDEKKEILKHVLENVLLSPVDSPTYKALENAGISSIVDLITYPDEEIRKLQVKIHSGNYQDLNTGLKQALIYFKQWAVILIQDNGGDLLPKDEWKGLTRADFNKWRIGQLSSSANIPAVPSFTTAAAASPATVSTDVTLFKRSIRRDASLFPSLKEDHMWNSWNLSF